MKRSFRMITLKQILPQICPGDWFMSLDLKDAYFHIQVAPHHRRFSRFAFEGVAYQYKVLPFGLSLAPRTFTRCMDAALSSLRQMWIHIHNYLDDRLILAQSQAVLTLQRLLKPRLGYVPEVLSTPFRAQVITLSAFFPPTGSQESLLCPVRALRIYIERSASYRKSEQLFVGFGNRAKGGPVTKQRSFRWLVDAITLAYSSSGLQCPIGVRAHSTRGIASS